MLLILTLGDSGTPSISLLDMVLGALSVLLMGMCGIVYFGSLALLYRHLTKDESAYLTHFLHRTVVPEPQTDPSAPPPLPLTT
jgi:hypothetical protein